jgi:hypothetical protein
MSADSHSEIRSFLQKVGKGEVPTGQQMRYDPNTRKFVVVDRSDKGSDGLPPIRPEDLEAFLRIK